MAGFLGNMLSPFTGGFNAAKGYFVPEKMPDRGYSELDSNTNQLIQGQIGRSEESAEDIANKQTAGTERAGQLMQSPDMMAQRSTALGMAADPASQAALSRRFSNVFGSDVNRIKQNAKAEAYNTKAERMNLANQSLQDSEAIRFGAARRAAEDDSNRRQARQDMISNIFNTGATIGGFAAGGGFGGGAKTAAAAAPMSSGSRQGGTFSTPGSRGGMQDR